MQLTQRNPGGLPPVPWSLARHQAWAECRRRYAWRYLVGSGGWRAKAEPVERTAYRLGKLTSLAAALGQSLHRRAAEYALACRERRPLPTMREARQRTRADLNFLVDASRRHRQDHLRDPRRWPMAHEWYYWGGATAEQIARTRERMERCLVGLQQSAVWPELRRCEPHDILVIDSFSEFPLEGVLVQCAPDLAFRPDASSPPVLVDFKSSPSDTFDFDEARLQLALYALWLSRGRRVPLIDDCCEGRLIFLADGTERQLWLTSTDLEDAAQLVHDSAADIAAGGGYPTHQEPHTPSEFPMNPEPRRCAWCPFTELCAPEVAASPTPVVLGRHVPPAMASHSTTETEVQVNASL